MIKNIFSNLIGKYSLKRILGNSGIGEGTASFIECQILLGRARSLLNTRILLYREELNINYYNHHNKIKAFKEYLYLLDDNKITKYFFNENKISLFYQMHFCSIKPFRAEAWHRCNLDSYKANYLFHDQDSFDLSYNVLGPYKNYTIETNYTRIIN